MGLASGVQITAYGSSYFISQKLRDGSWQAVPQLDITTFSTSQPRKGYMEIVASDLGCRANSRIKGIASWLLILPVLTASIAKDSAKIEVAGLAALAFVSVVILRNPVPRRAIRRIYWTGATLAIILCVYMELKPWPSWAGTSRAYDTQGIYFVLTYGVIAIFAVLFFEEPLFEKIAWRALTITLWIGVASCIASRLSHHLILTNPADGALRMQGTLSEPSAWAPVIPVIVILSIRRRSFFYLILALIGLLLADSPTCFLVLLICIPLYYLLIGNWRCRVPLLIVAVIIIPTLTAFVQSANANKYLTSTNSTEVALGRLISGIQNVETGGKAGTNTRYTVTTVVINEIRSNGWTWTGAGPAADITYFPAAFPVVTNTYRPSSLWLSVLFDFGIVGVCLLGALMVLSSWRMRTSPETAAILLPFFLAALINSAEGSFEYAFVVLGVMLYGFNWLPQHLSRRRLPQETPILA